MKKILPIIIGLGLAVALFFGISYQTNTPVSKVERKEIKVTQAGKKKTIEERALFNEARALHEYYMQVNPNTGEIPRSEKILEFKNARSSETSANRSSRAVEATFINRGPTNLGGRTRSLAQDVTDVTGNTMLACGISGGVFRTTDGGANWVKVSSNDEIHNASAIVQDKRVGFENIWYYGTGEGRGNSAAASQAAEATLYLGDGIWKSTDGGLNWSQMSSTSSSQESWDSRFDVVYSLAVHPITGDLYAANMGSIGRFDGVSWTTERTDPGTSWTGTFFTDVTITDSGRVYVAFSGNQDRSIVGIWTSATGIGGWSIIASGGSHGIAGRVVLALAPSNQDKLYTLFDNGNTASCTGPIQEVDLWMWEQGTTTWTDYSSTLPDETPCNDGTVGNVPMTVQGGYDMEISVKPNDENFVVIGGTNVYKKENITTAGNFLRVGGYFGPGSYNIYNVGGTEHHPDIHDLVFDFANPNILFSGTDGGVHEADITAGSVAWSNLNNNYQTFQFYHVGIDPLVGSDLLVGGAQDNGTNIGGTVGLGDLTTQERIFAGDGVAAEISRDNATIPIFLGSQFGNLYRVKNILTFPTYDYIEPTSSSSSFVTYFYLDPDNNNALYYAGQNTLYRTIDATNVTTSTWTNVGSTSSVFGHEDYFKTFSTTRGTYNVGTSYLLMGGDEGHIYRLDDPQNTMLTSAIDITPSTASTTYPTIVTGLAIHPTNNDIVLATYANYGTNSIYLTTNATSAAPTWTLVERNLSAHSIRSAAITEVGGEVLYFVGTARGLYSTPDPTSVDWTREAPTQLGYALISSLRYRPSDNKLLIGTHGNGVYEATVSTTLSLDDVNDISKQITLYPNPAQSEINFKSQNFNFDNNTTFSIIDILGKVVRSGTITNKKVDVSQLNSGLYFINIEANGLKQALKFIKK